MSIKEVREKIKQGRGLVLSSDPVFFASITALGIGALAGGISLTRSLSHPPVSFGFFDPRTGASLSGSTATSTPYLSNEELSRLPGAVFASKNGTKAYRLGCPGAARVAPENRIWFSSAAEAATLGYAMAPKCQ